MNVKVTKVGRFSNKVCINSLHQVTNLSKPKSGLSIATIRKYRDAKYRSVFHSAQNLPKSYQLLFRFNEVFEDSPVLSLKFTNWWHCLTIETLICKQHDELLELFPNLKKKDLARDHDNNIYSSARLTFLGVSEIHVVSDKIMRRPYMYWSYAVIQKIKEYHRLAIVIEDNKYDLENQCDYQTIIQFNFTSMELSVRPRKMR